MLLSILDYKPIVFEKSNFSLFTSTWKGQRNSLENLCSAYRDTSSLKEDSRHKRFRQKLLYKLLYFFSYLVSSFSTLSRTAGLWELLINISRNRSSLLRCIEVFPLFLSSNICLQYPKCFPFLFAWSPPVRGWRNHFHFSVECLPFFSEEVWGIFCTFPVEGATMFSQKFAYLFAVPVQRSFSEPFDSNENITFWKQARARFERALLVCSLHSFSIYSPAHLAGDFSIKSRLTAHLNSDKKFSTSTFLSRTILSPFLSRTILPRVPNFLVFTIWRL